MNTSVFATSNTIKNISESLQSRFFIAELEPYTYEQFHEITRLLFSHHKSEDIIASVIANAVWNKSQDIRDCIKIGNLVKSTKDVEFIVDKFFGPKTRHSQIQS